VVPNIHMPPFESRQNDSDVCNLWIFSTLRGALCTLGTETRLLGTGLCILGTGLCILGTANAFILLFYLAKISFFASKTIKTIKTIKTPWRRPSSLGGRQRE